MFCKHWQGREVGCLLLSWYVAPPPLFLWMHAIYCVKGHQISCKTFLEVYKEFKEHVVFNGCQVGRAFVHCSYGKMFLSVTRLGEREYFSNTVLGKTGRSSKVFFFSRGSSVRKAVPAPGKCPTRKAQLSLFPGNMQVPSVVLHMAPQMGLISTCQCAA